MTSKTQVSKKSYLFIIAAATLLLMGPGTLAETLASAAVVAAGVVLCAVFSRAAEQIFPRAVMKFSLVIWLALLGQMGVYFLGMTPYWILSAVILLPEIFESKQALANFWKRVFERILGLFMAVVWVACLREGARAGFGTEPFVGPVGLFLALAFLAAVWQNRAEKAK